MGRGIGSSESNNQKELELFLEGLCNMGFGSLPHEVLCQFHTFIVERFGYTPLPEDVNWEEVLNLAEDIFVGD